MRIVSLLPAATEIVAFLGATEHLVGITHACDYPAVVASRARVTRSAIAHGHGTSAPDPAAIDAAVRALSGQGHALFTLDESRIRALHPDLLLTQALCDVCAVRETDVQALASRLSPAPRVVTLGGTTLDGIYADIQTIADAIGAQSEAEELLAGLHDRVKHVHDTLKAAKAPRPRAAVIEWTSPVFLAGHWGPEQVRRAGGVDVLGTAGAHAVPVSMGALAAAEPEFVFVAPCGYSLAQAIVEAERLLHDDAWAWLRGRQVWALDANGLVSRPGPRVVDGIETMARVMNPMIFSQVDDRHARRMA
ncbi:MAG: ABC transporter substrate-binding protein [Gemmatimonadaceae bacterium]|nr:ABC transporter substrate-binding protein [Gemmatimonadaceae bacterium]